MHQMAEVKTKQSFTCKEQQEQDIPQLFLRIYVTYWKPRQTCHLIIYHSPMSHHVGSAASYPTIYKYLYILVLLFDIFNKPTPFRLLLIYSKLKHMKFKAQKYKISYIVFKVS